LDIAVSYALEGAQASAAANSVRKYELFRGSVGAGACIVGFVIVNSLDGDPTVGMACNIVLAVTLATLTVFTISWLRTAARVRKTAPKSTRPTTVSITDEGLTVARADTVAAKVTWKDVAHCTSADDIWIFALKGGKDAVLVPQLQLAHADREQIDSFLHAWGGKRRYRFSIW